MYLRIPWELVADPLGSVEDTLGTTGLLCLKSKTIIQIRTSQKWLGRLSVCYLTTLSTADVI